MLPHEPGTPGSSTSAMRSPYTSAARSRKSPTPSETSMSSLPHGPVVVTHASDLRRWCAPAQPGRACLDNALGVRAGGAWSRPEAHQGFVLVEDAWVRGHRLGHVRAGDLDGVADLLAVVAE